MTKKNLFIFVGIFAICLFFFYPVFKGRVPFPGDLLVSIHEPYKSDTDLGFARGGIPTKGQGSDVIRELYPWKYLSIELLKQGQVPFWNPYTFAGNPHLANYQSGAFYIFNVLFFIFPFLIAWSIYIFLEPLLASVFLYVYLKKINVSTIPAILGGICFAFSGFMIVWGQYGIFGHALLWLPLILFQIERIIETPKFFNYLLLILISLSSIFAGYIQLAIYVFLVSFCYISYRLVFEKRYKNFWKKYVAIYASLASAVLLAAFQILPTIQFLSLSLRAPYKFEELSIRLVPLANLITVIIPDFFGNPATHNYWFMGGSNIERATYIGIIPFVFVIVAVLIKNKYKNFFLALALITYFLALDILPVKLFHSIGIPFISTGVPSRILGIFSFSISILAAIGLEHFIKNPRKKNIFFSIALVAGIVCVSWGITYVINNPNFLVTRRNLVLPTFVFFLGAFLIVFSRFISKKMLTLLILLITILDLFYSFHKFTSFVNPSYVYPKTHVLQKLREIQGIDRYIAYGDAKIAANIQIYEKNYTPEGYDALYLKRYGELMSTSRNGKISNEIPHTVADIYKDDDFGTFKINKSRQKILNLLGVKYILERRDLDEIKNDFDYDSTLFDGENYKLLWQNNGWQVYENLHSVPRALLVHNYVVESNNNKIINRIFSNLDLKRTVILEEPLSDFNIKEGESDLKIEKYSPNEVIFKTSSKSDTILFLSDNYYPEWKAKIDDTISKVYRANYTFRAVPVKAGNHTITMYYDSDSFKMGLMISSFTAFMIVLWYLFFKKLKIA